jgi:PAS domain S-box-containing protein
MTESALISVGLDEHTKDRSKTPEFVRQTETAERIRVLHVDDNRAFLDLASEQLAAQKDSLSVHTELRVKNAIAHLKTNQVDCIVSDYNKSTQTGFDFLETVRETHPDLPFILFTAASAADVAREAITKGATDYLQKRTDLVQYELLANRIENAVSRYRSERRAEALESQCIEFAEETDNVLCTFTADMSEVSFVNPAFEDLYGIPVDQLCEDSLCFLNATHPDDRLYVEQAINRLQDGEPVEVEHRVNEQEEYQRWVRMQAQPIYTDDDEVARIVCIVTEITERKEREQRLRQFEQAVECSGRPFYFTDRDGGIEYVNPAFEQTTGYSAEEVIGKTPEMLQSSEQDQSFYENLWETLLEGETWRGELINQRKNGEQFVVDQTIAPVTDESGKIAHFVATCNEITERKERENKRKQVIDRMTGGVFELDADWKFTLINEQAATMLGRLRPELLGCNFWDVFTVAQGTTSEEQYRKVMATREPASFVEYYAGLDGWFNVRIYPNDDGGIAVYFREVTELKKREHHLELLDRVLRHNLRNNINVIRGRAELIENRTKNQVSEMAQQIVETSNNLISLAEKERKLVDVLQEDPEFKQVTVGTLLNTCVSTIDDEHPDATLSVDCPDETSITVCRKFDMAIKELLTNAVVHSNADSPEVAITVRSTSESVTIEIADDGPPIPDMEQSVLLQDNEQTPLYHGSGLGLSLVRMLTARSDGKIYVNRILQEGNIVELELPV